MANSQISTSVSGTDVTYYINIGIGDPMDWSVFVYAQTDRGLGGGLGSDPNYPYFVENFSGTDTKQIHKLYARDNYSAELHLRGILTGAVDIAQFSVSAPQTQGYSCSNCSSPTTCTPNVTPNCYGSQQECNTWCAGGTTGYSCSNCATTTTCTPGVTPNCYSSSQECTTQCPTGTGNYSCIDSCTTPTTCTPGVTSGCYASQTECTNNCASQMCLFGSCYQKNDIYAVVIAGAVVLFMFMQQQKSY